MGIVSRLSYTIRSKLNALVRSTEDPSETLDYSYERLRDRLQEVETGLADLTAQKKRLEVQRERLAQNVEKHDDQAWEAVKQGRDDLARRALEKKRAKRDQVAELDDQIADLEGTQRDLEERRDGLETKVEEFRTKKETMKARHEAAKTQTQVSEAVTGLSDDDVPRAIERAEDQTEEMEARAAAMDELGDRGVLEDSLSDDDRIEKELAAERGDDVESELAALRAEVRGEGDDVVERTARETGTEVVDENRSDRDPDSSSDADEVEEVRAEVLDDEQEV
ncbi:PspA/IM30 family protein [Halobacterium wangiae]|uniref:PspA/IM30 family protein n=1 Tax=Halobacterium wangiae TaxID=2902623 RepID=UPI001E56E9FF|nr:PspA/IM30 family protein [Halobacterium wangiae]